MGTGIQWGGQTTLAARGAIEKADRVLFAVADSLASQWVLGLNPRAEQLSYPLDGRRRKRIYLDMVERIMAEVEAGHRVCAVFYGHPGVLTFPAHEAIRRARSEGFSARMLPGVSSIDCLIADLGLDPGQDGCQVFEATLFLTRPRVVDVHTPMFLCQIGMIGNLGSFNPSNQERLRRGLAALGEALCLLFPRTHEAVIYEASTLLVKPPRADRIALGDLEDALVSELSTLYVPPIGRAPLDARMLARLGMAQPNEPGPASH
ncbi:SAM-dependent methyltransferase (plasmid) [Sorangium sp. So ce119]|uniref:SAM-dependent methyltransferase n=1 Tax=Sorangium sp. So ce119 TaxID=3133279 RepID=UPI003F6280E0